MMEKTYLLAIVRRFLLSGRAPGIWVKTVPDVRRRLLHYERAWNAG
jgi:hypothetical protein